MTSDGPAAQRPAGPAAKPAPPAHERQAILQSLQAGVVPRSGLQHLAVGRVAEVRQLLAELEVVAGGGGAFKVVSGDYGSGKTFLLALVRQVALGSGFLVADADLSPDHRLRGDGRGLATYRQMMARLSSATRPDGGALALVLDRFADGVRAEAEGRTGSTARTPAMSAAFADVLRARLLPIREQPEGFPFAAAVRHHSERALSGDDEGCEAALRLLRGEYRSASAARPDFGGRTVAPPSDDRWHEYLALVARLGVEAGFRGLLVLIDEGVNLFRIASPESRAANYEVLLRICNAALQGRSPHLGVYLAGPPEMIVDSHRGFHSYPALRSRLAGNPYADAAHPDLVQPVMTLRPLSNNELLALLLKVRNLHAAHYGGSGLADDDVRDWLARIQSRPGAERFLTVREALRTFIQALNILAQHPDADRGAVLGQAEEALAAAGFVDVSVATAPATEEQ